MDKHTNQVQQSVPQRDADLLHLWTVYLQAAAGAAKAQALASFNAEVGKRAHMDAAVRSLVQGLLSNVSVLTAIQVKLACLFCFVFRGWVTTPVCAGRWNIMLPAVLQQNVLGFSGSGLCG